MIIQRPFFEKQANTTAISTNFFPPREVFFQSFIYLQKPEDLR